MSEPISTTAPATVDPPKVEPAPPPAAELVVNGDPAQIEELRVNLETERTHRRKHEQRINELEDENRRLKDVTRPVKKEKGQWEKFFDGED